MVLPIFNATCINIILPSGQSVWFHNGCRTQFPCIDRDSMHRGFRISWPRLYSRKFPHVSTVFSSLFVWNKWICQVGGIVRHFYVLEILTGAVSNSEFKVIVLPSFCIQQCHVIVTSRSRNWVGRIYCTL